MIYIIVYLFYIIKYCIHKASFFFFSQQFTLVVTPMSLMYGFKLNNQDKITTYYLLSIVFSE